MSWEGWGVLVAILGLVITIIGAILGAFKLSSKFSFFAGQFLTKVDGIGSAFSDFEKAFEKHMADEATQLKAMWEKIDAHNGKIIEHDQRIIHVEKFYKQ